MKLGEVILLKKLNNMIKIYVFGLEFIYRLSIDDKFIGNDKKYYNKTVSMYDEISSSIDRSSKDIPGEAKGSYKRFGRTIKNMAKNAFDNSFGYIASSWQNYKTKRALKKGDHKPIVYTIHGRVQNKGAHWRMGKELKKQGFHVYHLKGNHGLGDVNKSKEKAYAQMDKLHKYAGTNPASINSYISGHSSGADLGAEIAKDDKLHDYGIKGVQYRAGTPYGIKKKNLYSRAVAALVNIKDDFRNTDEGKAKMAKNYFSDPKVPIYASVGKYDRLVNPKDGFYKSATSFKVLDHKDAGHFGTSGQHKKINKYNVDELKKMAGNYGANNNEKYKDAA